MLWNVNRLLPAVLKYWFNLQKVSEKKLSFGLYKTVRGILFFITSTKNSGDRGYPLSTIGINAKSVTNFRSRLAMHGAEFHGNTCRDGTTRKCSIGLFF